MHAYILRTDSRISPFGEPASTLPVHNEPLGMMQKRVLVGVGCSVEEIDELADVRRLPCVLVHDDVYFTRHAMAGFLRAVRRPIAASGQSHLMANTSPADVANARAALAASELTERFTPALQGECVEATGDQRYRAYDIYYLNQLDPRRSLAEQSALVAVPHRQTRIRSRTGRRFEPSGRFVVPVSLVFCHPVRHWSALVTINLLGMTSYFLVQLRARPLCAASLPFRMVWRSASLRPTRWLCGLYLCDHGCRIHPTACIEGAILGRHVRVGPNAVVRGTVIGDHAEIGAGALIEGCTLGRRVVVNPNIILRGCVILDDATIGAYFTQLSVVGRDAVMCPTSGIADFNVQGTVRVRDGGRTVDSGSRLLGGCVGHGAFLGPHVIMACGYELPNGSMLVPDGSAWVRDITRGLPHGVISMNEPQTAESAPSVSAQHTNGSALLRRAS